MAEDRDRPSPRLNAWGLLAVALVALGACAAGGPHPETPSAERPSGQSIAGADGTPLALSVWPAERPRAVILGLHGYGDYAETTFEEAGPDWAAAGITTYAYDQRGFGRNPSRARWPGADALIADARAAAVEIRARHPDLPLVVLGVSMGGGVALAAAPEIAADGIVLVAPAIWGGAALNPLHRTLAWLAALTVPERRFTGEGVVRIRPTDNIEALRRLARDPLYLGPPSAREIFGLVRITDRAAAAAEKAELPALLLLGARDEIVPEAAVRRVFAQRPGPGCVRRFEDGWHMLLRDLGAARVRAEIAGWVVGGPGAARCPTGGTVRTAKKAP